MEKVIIYYTDNKLDENIASYCFQNLLEVSQNTHIIAVTQKHEDYIENSNPMVHEVRVEEKSKSRQSMFEQIQIGLIIAKRYYQPDVVYLAEHDVLYTKDHFNFIPVGQNIFHYNLNKYWMTKDVFIDCAGARHLSTLCCSFNLLLAHMNWRLYRIQHLGMKKGGLTKSEPGCSEMSEKYCTGPDYTGKVQTHYTIFPCIDIRHGNNLSNIIFQQYLKTNKNKVVTCVPYWGNHKQLKGNMKWIK